MTTRLKLLIGFSAAMIAGWISHGPAGRGEAFIARLEAQGRAALEAAEVPDVTVRMKRGPLERIAMLSGPANDFQREGQGLYPGINDRIRDIPGVAGIEWTNPPVQD